MEPIDIIILLSKKSLLLSVIDVIDYLDIFNEIKLLRQLVVNELVAFFVLYVIDFFENNKNRYVESYENRFAQNEDFPT